MGWPHSAHGRPFLLTLSLSLVRLEPLALLGLPIYAPLYKAPYEAPICGFRTSPYARMRPSMGDSPFRKHSSISV